LIVLSDSYRALFVLGGVATLTALWPLAYAPGAGPSPVLVPVLGRRMRIVAAVVLLWLVTLAFGLLSAKTELADVDASVFRKINDRGPGPDVFWGVVNPHIRNYVILGLVPLFLAVVTRARSVRVVATAVLGSAALALVLLYTMYAVWDRARPEDVFGEENIHLVPGHTFSRIASYPSGHLVMTVALAAVAAWLFPMLRVPAWTYVVLTAFSRILFGSHFPSDVIGGFVLGLGSAYAVVALLSDSSFFGLTGAKTAQSTRRPSRNGLKELLPPG
jgi:membrane-associated phospholipid phosphatase